MRSGEIGCKAVVVMPEPMSRERVELMETAGAEVRLTPRAEIVRQLQDRGVKRLDAFIVGVGTGGTIMGVGRALRTWQPHPAARRRGAPGSAPS